ncbi:ABC transmembrane type-1 domain-containing protein [Rhabdochlamydiaceae symbiont of Dictyostelium giganteum]
MIRDALPLLMKGSVMTLQIALLSFIMSLVIGTVCGILTCRHLKIRGISECIEGVTFVLRAIPFFVQLLLMYFVIPDVLKIDMTAVTASIISLGLCSSGYMTQIIKSGLDAVPVSQWELTFSLGYTTYQSLRFGIFPQAFLSVLPNLNNELESLLKSTAIVSSIGVLELTRMGMNIVSREMEPVPIYLTVALFYTVMSLMIKCLSLFLERRFFYVKS